MLETHRGDTGSIFHSNYFYLNYISEITLKYPVKKIVFPYHKKTVFILLLLFPTPYITLTILKFLGIETVLRHRLSSLVQSKSRTVDKYFSKYITLKFM